MAITRFSTACNDSDKLDQYLQQGISEISFELPWQWMSENHSIISEALAGQFARAAKGGLKTSLIISGACTANHEFSLEGMRTLHHIFAFVNQYKVDFVTLNQPFLIRALREFCPQTRIRIAADYEADNLGKFEFLLDYLKADVVTVSPLANKNFRLLREVCARWEPRRLEIVCSDACIMGCPYRTWCSVCNAHVHSGDPTLLPQVSPCLADISHNRDTAIAAMFVRRQDLRYYQSLGIERFNIRSEKADDLDCVEYYTGQTASDYAPNFLKSRFKAFGAIQLEAMDGYYTKFFEEACDGAKYNCSECDHCRAYARRVFPMDADVPAHGIPEPAAFFSRLYFSRYTDVVIAHQESQQHISEEPTPTESAEQASADSKNRAIRNMEQYIGRRISPEKFPLEALPSRMLKFLLFRMRQECQGFYKRQGMGDLLGAVAPQAAEAWKMLIEFNPNNIGNWSMDTLPPYSVTTRREREVIQKMADLYGVKPGRIEGYVASGGTEGNIFAVWVGRKYLEKYVSRPQIRLLRTDLTHYSVRKAADICGLNDHIVATDRKNWNMSLTNLQQKIHKLYTRGIRGILLPLTVGYTVGGASDDLQRIAALIRSMQHELSGLRVFIWIDAALAGLVRPFTPAGFTPFESPLTQMVVVDFHKFGGAPYPAGLVLYRQALRALIEKDIPYTLIKDNTLLGSRPGISAVAAWMSIHALGFAGMQQHVDAMLARKNRFIDKLKPFNAIEIITDPNSVQMAIIANSPLPEAFCAAHGIYPLPYRINFTDRIETLNVYKLFFLPRFD